MSESKGFIATNWFKLFIVAVVALIIAIYFHREYRLDSCMEHANEVYSRVWDDKCSAEKKGASCNLNPFIATDINKMRDAQINECFRRYSFK